MSHRKHKVRAQPRVSITKPGVNFKTDKGVIVRHATLATPNHTYHATKGWRKNRRDTRKGFAFIYTLVARAFE